MLNQDGKIVGRFVGKDERELNWLADFFNTHGYVDLKSLAFAMGTSEGVAHFYADKLMREGLIEAHYPYGDDYLVYVAMWSRFEK